MRAFLSDRAEREDVRGLLAALRVAGHSDCTAANEALCEAQRILGEVEPLARISYTASVKAEGE